MVVGLGNPGTEYEGTRHNLGAAVARELVRREGEKLVPDKQKSMSAELKLAGSRVAVAVPLTYMNLSGEAVAALVRRHGIEDLDRVVVVHDELDLEPGRIKVKVGGGLAGHNGLKSIKQQLRDDGFVRVRVGVGKAPGTMSGADYVLRKPGKAERELFDAAVARAADAIESIVQEGVDAAMTRFNA